MDSTPSLLRIVRDAILNPPPLVRCQPRHRGSDLAGADDFWLWAATIVVMGSLQAWDSGTSRAPGLIQAIVALAIAISAVTVVTTPSYPRQVLAVGVAFVLLTVARMASPMSLPTLHIIAFVPAVLIFFTHAVHGQPALSD